MDVYIVWEICGNIEDKNIVGIFECKNDAKDSKKLAESLDGHLFTYEIETYRMTRKGQRDE